MIEFSNITPQSSAKHFDVATLFYRWLWGPHIHHGLWEADETPREAQVRLTRRLAELAAIEPASKILDAGCGLGASSRWLADHLQCQVTGVTNSRLQKHWATTTARLKHCQPLPKFIFQDIEQWTFQPESFDVVWNIECTEHLFDKAAFINHAASCLKKHGRLAICAFLVGENETSTGTIEQVRQVFDGMSCPSIGTQSDYENWIQAAGLELSESQLWTKQVLRTWEICRQKLDRGSIRFVARVLGQDHQNALDRLDALLKAYQNGAMEYGCFVAQKKSC